MATHSTASSGQVPVAGPADTVSPAVETRRVTVGGLEHRVLIAGSGWPLVLLHGLGGSADEWLAVLPQLAIHYRVVAPDAIGHGLSDKPAGGRYDLAAYTEFVLGVTDAFGIRRAPLVAVSGAGAVALSLALTHPDRISRLVLVAAAGLGRTVAWRYRLATLPFTSWFLRRADRRSVEASGRSLCYAPDKLPAGWIDRRMEIWSTPGAVDAFVATVRACISLRGQRADFTRRLGEIRHPTLLVWGREDPILPVSHALAAQAAFPNAQVRVFDRCGHMPMWEYPSEFAQTVLEFLGG
ncbi:MAG: alpha/beta fold hydrolase [Chloroflexi bacterium]|nr:alpha/beta fold hydrolase [Chloroflexota bacterium]